MITGVDVSSHQRSTPSLEGHAFLIARACYGLDRDGRFADHIAAARRRGLVTGAYLFLRHGEVAGQVGALLGAIAGVGDVDLVAIDWESDGAHVGATSAEARQAIKLVQAAGRRVGLYASSSRFPRDSFGADWRWVADYRPLDQPPVPWDVWQWTSSAGGIRLDRNRYRGTVAELRELGRREDPPDMKRTLRWIPGDPPRAGRLTVAGSGHWFLRLHDDSIGGPIDPADPNWHDREAIGPFLLVPDIDGKATTGERARTYVVGPDAVALLTFAATFTPDAGADRDGILDEAIAAVAGLKGA